MEEREEGKRDSPDLHSSFWNLSGLGVWSFEQTIRLNPNGKERTLSERHHVGKAVVCNRCVVCFPKKELPGNDEYSLQRDHQILFVQHLST